MSRLLLVSIIMPIRNEACHIQRTLEAALGQDYPMDRMEVIVADGMSTDGTRDIVQALKEKHLNLVLIDNPDRIVSSGINTALRLAKGEIITLAGGHCQIAHDYVSRCVQYLENNDLDCVGGPIQTVGQTFTAKSIALAMSSFFGVGGSAFRTVKDRSMLVDTVAFAAYKMKMIQRVGLFDEELVRNQDDEYNYRLRELGGKILLVPDVRSRYHSRSSLRALWSQYFQYGFWKVRVLQKHLRQMRPRQFAPPAFVAVLLSSAVIGIFSLYGQVVFALVAGTYLVANLSASIWTVVRSGWRSVVLLPLVYAILHLSYGFGFLIGLVKFARRWGDKQGKVPAFRPVDDQILAVTRSQQEYANSSQNLG